MKCPARALLSLIFSLGISSSIFPQAAEPQKADADFDKLALDFIGGYLAARPLQGVALGFHQYDGKIGDYSRLAIDAEVERLKRFQARLEKMDVSMFSKRAALDRRILQTAINVELAQIVE